MISHRDGIAQGSSSLQEEGPWASLKGEQDESENTLSLVFPTSTDGILTLSLFCTQSRMLHPREEFKVDRLIYMFNIFVLFWLWAIFSNRDSE